MEAAGTLTKLYPGAYRSYRDLIDILQVVFDIVFGHSVQKYAERERSTGVNNTNNLRDVGFSPGS